MRPFSNRDATTQGFPNERPQRSGSAQALWHRRRTNLDTIGRRPNDRPSRKRTASVSASTADTTTDTSSQQQQQQQQQIETQSVVASALLMEVEKETEAAATAAFVSSPPDTLPTSQKMPPPLPQPKLSQHPNSLLMPDMSYRPIVPPYNSGSGGASVVTASTSSTITTTRSSTSSSSHASKATTTTTAASVDTTTSSTSTTSNTKVNAETPKKALHSLYGHSRRVVLDKSNYFTWNSPGPAHNPKWTAVFVCPTTGEVFTSCRYGDPQTYDVVSVPTHDANPISSTSSPSSSSSSLSPPSPTVWYYKKVNAEHAAACRALDCLRYRAALSSSSSTLVPSSLETQDVAASCSPLSPLQTIIQSAPFALLGQDPPYLEPRPIWTFPNWIPGRERALILEMQAKVQEQQQKMTPLSPQSSTTTTKSTKLLPAPLATGVPSSKQLSASSATPTPPPPPPQPIATTTTTRATPEGVAATDTWSASVPLTNPAAEVFTRRATTPVIPVPNQQGTSAAARSGPFDGPEDDDTFADADDE